jgi:peptidoglycan/xylan/chitin deacetylase (PgdA/CDA1 family)
MDAHGAGGGFDWPQGASVAVSLTFDLDAESGFLGDGAEYAERLSALSEGRFGIVRGLPRILGLLKRHRIHSTFFVPGYTAEIHPDCVLDILEDGHEVGHHGYLHLRNDKVSATSQRQEIERGLESLEKRGAPRPRGYRSPAWEITPETFALIVQEGFSYDSSCMGDDRPYVEHFNGMRVLELPIHWSLDDFPRYGWSVDAGGNMADPVELYQTWLSEYGQAREEGRHITYTMHPEVIGRAHRFAQLESLVHTIESSGDVWFARLDEVADHVRPMLIGD